MADDETTRSASGTGPDFARMTEDDLKGRTPDELRRLFAGIDAGIRAMHQDERGGLAELTDEQREALEHLLTIRSTIKGRLDHHDKVMRALEEKAPQIRSAMVSIGADDDPYAAIRSLGTQEVRDQALRRLDNRYDTAHMSDAQKTEIERAIRVDTSIARRVLVTETPAYRTAYMKLMTRQFPNLSDDERKAVGVWEEFRAMSENTTTAGGFGVPAFVDASIMLTAQESGNPFLSIARQVQSPSNVWKGVSSAGVSWSFGTEASAATDNSPTLAQPSVTIHMAKGFIPYSIEVGMDYPAFADEMNRLLEEGYNELLIDKFTRGSGTGEPFGILTVLSAAAGSRVRVATAGTNFNAADPYTVWKALPQKNRNRANWLMSVGVNNAFRQLGVADEYHASTVNLTAGWAESFFNRDAYESTYMPDVTTSTTAPEGLAVVGNFQAFVIARRGGLETEPIAHLFQQVTAGSGPAVPTGQRGIFAHARIGSNVVDTNAFRLLVNT